MTGPVRIDRLTQEFSVVVRSRDLFCPVPHPGDSQCTPYRLLTDSRG